MYVTAEHNRQNLRTAWLIAGSFVAAGLLLTLLSPWFLLLVPLGGLVFYCWMRRTARRWQALQQPFPEHWTAILNRDVTFYRALDADQRTRFRQLMQVFLSDVRITGIGTDVDDTTKVLVAASAIIPIFGFDSWEYARLGEILIYPNAFDDRFRVTEQGDSRTLGMVGDGHLSGVMILSKPDLLAGFRLPTDKRNVGIHEFAHLVDKADGAIDGVPPGISREIAEPWIRWVGEELRSTSLGKNHIDDYAYTNEAEYFAVLTEYFFEQPEVLANKAPDLYRMLESIYRQKTRGLLAGVSQRPRRTGRNALCPCGSGEKYKRCCKTKASR